MDRIIWLVLPVTAVIPVTDIHQIHHLKADILSRVQWHPVAVVMASVLDPRSPMALAPLLLLQWTNQVANLGICIWLVTEVKDKLIFAALGYVPHYGFTTSHACVHTMRLVGRCLQWIKVMSDRDG